MTETTAPKSPIPGMKELIIGGVGSGKTSLLRSAVATGLEVRAIFTEPSFEVVTDIPCEKGFHFLYMPPANPSWDDMLSSAKIINTSNQKGLAGLDDISKNKYPEFMDLIRHCNSYKCSRCGTGFGDVLSWGTHTMLWIDSLSGINDMALNLVVGSKPIKAMGDWGMAMDNLKRLLSKLATTPRCHVTVVGHVEKERDEQLGFDQLMVSTLGKKLAPEIPRYFSDVVLAKRVGANFFLSTTAQGVDVKGRNWPLRDDIPADFKLALETWKSRGGIVEEA